MIKYKNIIFTDHLGKPCENQKNNFTKNHIKYNLSIIATMPDGSHIIRRTQYQYAPKYTSFKANDGILAILNDSLAGSYDYKDFLCEYGYDDTPEARRVYKACLCAHDWLEKLGLGNDDILQLIEQLDQ